MKSLTEKFIEELGRIKDPVTFLGVARILKVKLLGEDSNPREFADILSDTINEFDVQGRARRRELYKILREANKCKEGSNGNNTEDSTETIPNQEV